MTLCSFPAATILPVKVAIPTTNAKAAVINSNELIPEESAIKSVPTIAEAIPPNPFNKATI
jgi:hypothetical protein